MISYLKSTTFPTKIIFEQKKTKRYSKSYQFKYHNTTTTDFHITFSFIKSMYRIINAPLIGETLEELQLWHSKFKVYNNHESDFRDPIEPICVPVWNIYSSATSNSCLVNRDHNSSTLSQTPEEVISYNKIHDRTESSELFTAQSKDPINRR